MDPRTSAASEPVKRRPVLSLVISLLIVLFGLVQLLSTAHTYAVSASQLSALRSQQAALQAKKDDLENNINRWKDKNYVVAQARERLGFVFPGEVSVLVLNSGQPGGTDSAAVSAAKKAASQPASSLPWYKELQYSFAQADGQQKLSGGKFQDGTAQ